MTIEIYINNRGSHQSLVDKYFTPIESIENEGLSVQEAEHYAFHCMMSIKSSCTPNFVEEAIKEKVLDVGIPIGSCFVRGEIQDVPIESNLLLLKVCCQKITSLDKLPEGLSGFITSRLNAHVEWIENAYRLQDWCYLYVRFPEMHSYVEEFTQYFEQFNKAAIYRVDPISMREELPFLSRKYLF